ncbi:hypothetical protein yc1106_09016 [Curvularia clavata]|uniref:DNA2/NAM7 helicase-like C-terminal domain-containing protein n=1 Tax=Curvularia clavata TaxID=95742 RepID=A0A9Q9DWC6_CURCL|nr:hypothetical protein yc1106_09016 [Curvularia clavata]
MKKRLPKDNISAPPCERKPEAQIKKSLQHIMLLLFLTTNEANEMPTFQTNGEGNKQTLIPKRKCYRNTLIPTPVKQLLLPTPSPIPIFTHGNYCHPSFVPHLTYIHPLLPLPTIIHITTIVGKASVKVKAMKTDDGKDKKKPEFLEGISSEVHQEVHDVMASYVVDGDTKDLKVAKKISSSDLNFPLLIANGEDLKTCTESKPYMIPEGAMLHFKKRTLPPRSRAHAKKREAQGKQIRFNKLDTDKIFMITQRQLPMKKELRALLEDAAIKANAEGIPVWDYIMHMPEVNHGRQRSRSVPAYQPTSRRNLNREELTPDLRRTAVAHFAETAAGVGGLSYPTSEQIMTEYHRFLAKRPHRMEEDNLAPEKDDQSSNKQDNQSPAEKDTQPSNEQDDQPPANDDGWADDNGCAEGDSWATTKKSTRTPSKKITDFRDWLRFGLKWMVTVEQILQVVDKRFFVLGTGLIPVNKAFRNIKQADLDHYISLQNPPKLFNEDKEKEEDYMPPKESFAKIMRKFGERAEAYRRIFPPERSLTEVAAKAEKFKQNKEDLTRMFICTQPQHRSYGRLVHTVNYIDETTPDIQLQHVVYVDLTYENARVPPRDDTDLDYIPTHKVMDVTDPTWIPTLKKLFPQTADIDKYYDDVRTMIKLLNHRLYLMVIKHNEATCTSNLFTHKDVPEMIKDLQVMMRKSPAIFILARSSDFDQSIEKLVQQFRNLALYNPLNEFFVEVLNPSLTNKGIRPMEDLPKFTAVPQYHFSNWQEFTEQVGIGAIIEQRFAIGTHTYDGIAAVIPVPATYKRDAKLNMAYHLQVMVKYDSNKPRLMPGDSVLVDLNPKKGASVASEVVWKGRVTEPTQATPMGTVSIVIERPWKENSIADTTEYSKLEISRLRLMSPPELVKWTTENCKRGVQIFVKNDEKECKRLTGNISKMTMSKKHKIVYEEKAEMLDKMCQMLLCRDHTISAAAPLYQGIQDPERANVIEYIASLLRPHQEVIYSKWAFDGIYNKTIWLTGPSGSGKTYLATMTALPYLGGVKVSQNVINILNHEQAVYFQLQTLAEAIKAPTQAGGDVVSQSDDKCMGSCKGKKEGPKINIPKPERSDKYVTQRGRITMVALQNEAVDNLYALMDPIAREYCKRMGFPVPLVLRIHNRDVEINAVKAMARPSYHPTKERLRFSVDPDAKATLTSEVAQSLLEGYLEAYRGGQPGIADRRFKKLQGSAAKYILELADFPCYPQSSELRAAFTLEERRGLVKELAPLRQAHKDLKGNNDNMTKDIALEIAKAAQLGFDKLIERASVVCTTMSVATQPSFNMTRRSHAVLLEEAGRANDAETMGLFGHYWSADMILVSGATNQLKPSTFGDEKQNPFHHITGTSTISRLGVTGGNVNQLIASSRFFNEALFELCAAVNNIPKMEPVEGAFDEKVSSEYAKVNKSIWGVDTNLLFINTTSVTPMKNANGSTYCKETAATAMKDAVERLQYIEGFHHAIITPYNAQVLVLRKERDFAAFLARSQGKVVLAKRLMDMEISTIDSYMGRDKMSVTLDTTGKIGHLFEYRRTVVALTRARVSCVVIAPTYEYTICTDKVKESHPLVKIILLMEKRGWIRSLGLTEIRSFSQYQSITKVTGLGDAELPQVYKKAATMAATDYSGPCEQEQLDIIRKMQELDQRDERDNVKGKR